MHKHLSAFLGWDSGQFKTFKCFGFHIYSTWKRINPWYSYVGKGIEYKNVSVVTE